MNITAEQIGRLGSAALAKEARLTPKPGLVDAENNGAHTDMDLALLLKSAAALEPYFKRFAFLGMQDASLPSDGRLSAIRADGIQAQEAMFAVTNGINTHKGAIFLLGILCYCAGYHAANGYTLTLESVCSAAARVCRGVTNELGENAGRAYARYGAKGARGEAEDGYPNTLAALSAFHAAKRLGADEEDGWRIALLTLISRVEDSNVLARCGEEAAKAFRARAEALARRHPAGGEALAVDMRELDQWCQTRRASPGGAADLLACAIFLDSLSWNAC